MAGKCASCGADFPADATFRFCPFCGAAQPEAATAPAQASGTDPYLDAVPDISASEAQTHPELAAVPEPGLRDTIIGSVPEDDPTEAPTRMELPAISDELLGSSASAPAIVQPSSPKPVDDATVEELPAVEPRVSLRRKPESASAPERRVVEPYEAPVDDSRKFSETAWFLAAVSPEQLGETEGEATSFEEADAMTQRYERAGKLPKDVRQSFSLKSARTLEETKAVDDD